NLFSRFHHQFLSPRLSRQTDGTYPKSYSPKIIFLLLTFIRRRYFCAACHIPDHPTARRVIEMKPANDKHRESVAKCRTLTIFCEVSTLPKPIQATSSFSIIMAQPRRPRAPVSSWARQIHFAGSYGDGCARLSPPRLSQDHPISKLLTT